jgi:peroxiredoxin/uncharacterized membrane protein YphA (DoxX/SURF4 family)
MDTALLMARVLLAAVFLVAGLAKLADRVGSRQALVGFGLPPALSGPLGVLLPLAELAVAVALLPTETAGWGAVGALALLLTFSAAIAINLARGRRPACRCFGQLHSSPVGFATLARNGALAAMAGGVVWQGPEQPGPEALAPLTTLVAAQPMAVVGLAMLGVLIAEAALLYKLLLQNGRLLVRLEAVERRLAEGGMGPAAPTAAAARRGLPLGAPAPAFALPGVYGETLTLDALRAAGRPVLLLFTDPGCGPCNALMPDVGGWQREQAARLTIAVVSRGAPEASRAKAAEHGLAHVLLQRDDEVANAYQAHGTPAAVLVRPDGTIGSPLALGVDEIRALAAQPTGATGMVPVPMAPPAAVPNGHAGHAHGSNGARPAAAAPAGPAIGKPAPALELPDLDGKRRRLADLGGSPTLVLFWNPGCGFCQQMLPDLKAWDERPPEGPPKLLVVSSGTVEANKAMGLRSPVLVDDSFGAGRAYGANGTPMAVLVDAEGRIASPLGVGAEQVLALANGGVDAARSVPE